MSASSSCNDGSFGPTVRNCDRNFDFTLTFEESILSIAPSLIFIFLVPIRISQLKNKPNCVGGEKFFSAKLIAIAVFLVLQLVLLVLWSLGTDRKISISKSSATLSLVAASLLGTLSGIEHFKSFRPSALINVYLLFSVLFDATRTRTLWLINNGGAITIVFTVSLAVKTVILVLETVEKRRYMDSIDRRKGPEETSGIFDRSVFWWLNPLIKTGFSKALRTEDLYPIDEKMSAKVLGTDFEQIWLNSNKSGEYRLIITLIKLFKWQIMAPVLPRLYLIGFTFCQPLLLNRYLNFLGKPTESLTVGYGLFGAYGIVYFGFAVSTGFYWHQVYRCVTMIRGSLISAVYKKTTDISTVALDSSAAVTLMSTDIERIQFGLRSLHECWASIIQIVIATWLLQRQLGLACIVPVVIACISATISSFVVKDSGKKQSVWVEAIQKRVGITSTMLNNMKGVRMSGLAPKLSAVIQQLRMKELFDMTSFRSVLIYCAVLAYVPQQISPVATFGAFVGIETSDGRVLNTSRTFTSISLLVLLNQSLAQVFQSIPSLTSSISCLKRIQKYLSVDSRMDFRVLGRKDLVPATSHTTGGKGSAANVEDSGDIELEAIKTTPKSRRNRNRGQGNDGSGVISIHDGAFGWKADELPVIQDINLTITRGQLTIIVGPVASGKSTLIKALLGETPSYKGLVQIATLDFSFCDQTPWLLSQTIQKNVIGFNSLDPEWYKTVIHACALDEDISLLPQGDNTVIGSNGITLSESQKQRVAIARAVYARKKVAVFDDVFSGLDAPTERRIFQRVFGLQGLLRRNGTTVILATHAVNFLPWADHIVVLDRTGTITEQGSFNELNSETGSYVRSFNLSRESGSLENDETESISPLKPREVSINSVEATEDKTSQTEDISTYKYYFSAAGLANTLLFWALELTWAFLETLPFVWLKWWSSAITGSDHPSNTKYLVVYAALQVGGLIALFSCAMHVFNTMQVKAGTKLHLRTLATVTAAPLAFFGSTGTGVTLNRFSQDFQLIDGELPDALFNAANLGLRVIGQAALIASATWYVAISFPFLIAVFYYIHKCYLRTSRQLWFMDLEAKSPLYTQFIESLSGLVTLRAFRWQKPNHTLNDKLLDSSQRPLYLLYMVQQWLALVMDFISLGLVLVVVGLTLKFKSSVSVGFTGVALVNIMSLGQNMKWVVLQWTKLETAIGAVSRIKSFEVTTASENLRSEVNQPPPNWPSTGSVEIKDLAISYHPETDKNVLENFNLSIRPGEKIGICGRSGSGKSSLVLALFRMIEISKGSIVIDGLDISTLPRQEVRARINAIPQDPYFPPGTIRSNLDPWGTQSDDDLVNALQKVELWKLIQERGGLDTEMDVNTLSHGQRQLFCLGRAILRPGNIVVLDEATSSVDRKTEGWMQRIIRKEFSHHTIIAITHRIETILDFDRIAVLHNGRLVECDTPTHLLATPSAFKEMYEMYEAKREEQPLDSISIATYDS
ncbi:ABC transporter-like protein [Xylogone sp. PMI_703]|nr:ABC transporter-like protein [Xylogone sp. PMI_703]